MKVIMLQDLKKVGKKGDIIEVAEGYGRNYLIAKKYAVEATKQNLNEARAKQKSAERKNSRQMTKPASWQLSCRRWKSPFP